MEFENIRLALPHKFNGGEDFDKTGEAVCQCCSKKSSSFDVLSGEAVCGICCTYLMRDLEFRACFILTEKLND